MGKRILKALVFVAVLVVVFPAGGQAKKTAITFWHNFGDDFETPYFNKTLVPQFQKLHPEIQLTAVAQGADRYSERIITALGTQTPPDVARIDATQLMNYVKLGGLLALDSLKGFAELKSRLFPGALSSNFYQGKYYGLPLDTNCKAAAMNMTNLKKLGFTQPPKTMEELVAAVRKSGVKEPVINVSAANDWDFLPYFWLYGGVLSDAGFSKATGFLDSAKSIEAMKQLKALHDEGILTIKDIDGSTDAWGGILTGEYGVIFEGPWFFAANPKYEENGVVPALIPSYKGATTSIVGGQSIAVFSTSKNQEAAFEFVKYMLSDEVQLQMGTKMLLMPVNKTAAENPAFTKNPVWSVYLKQLATAKARIPSPQKQVIEETLTDAFDAVMRGAAEPETALHEAALELDKVLAK